MNLVQSFQQDITNCFLSDFNDSLTKKNRVLLTRVSSLLTFIKPLHAYLMGGVQVISSASGQGMGYIITYEGIENVVMDLDYVNPNTLKHKYVHFIKSRYTPETDILSMRRPDPDGLIRMIWGLPDDPEAIRAKRKNLSSIRSAVNSDLKDLFQKGLNP